MNGRLFKLSSCLPRSSGVGVKRMDLI